MTDRSAPKVFLAHRSPDKDAARTLAVALRGRGIDVWFDAWEIAGGDNFVEKMEEGLTQSDGGLLFCTATGFSGTWTYEEYSVMLTRVVEHRGDGRRPFLIPVRWGPDPEVPLFLGVRHGRHADEVEALAQDVERHLGRRDSDKPPLGPMPTTTSDPSGPGDA